MIHILKLYVQLMYNHICSKYEKMNKSRKNKQDILSSLDDIDKL